MTYLRSLFLNFLIIFFVNDVIPGIKIHDYEKVINIGADIGFSLIVGLCNSLIFPTLAIFNLKFSISKIVICAAIISFGAYFLISITSFGVQVTSFAGFLTASCIVFAMAVFTNYLEMKHYISRDL